MPRDLLREQLDNASLAPRGGRRAKWVAEARGFAEPVWEAVERALADRAQDEAAAAHEFFASVPVVIPRLTVRAWIDGFVALSRRSRVDNNPVLKTVAQRLADEPDVEVALPLLLAGFSRAATRASTDNRRVTWVSRQPWGPAAAVAVLLQDDRYELRDGAVACLAYAFDLPTAGRAALWLTVWNDPRSVRRAWPVLARLREPAAVAALFTGHGSVPDALLGRPATTRALVRLIAGDDPWLPGVDPETLLYPSDGPEQIVRLAVAVLPWAARASGEVDAARTGLASRWPTLPGGAVAWALLGGVEAVPALLEQLGEDDTPALALAALGPLAADAADAARSRLSGPLAALVEAALRPTPEALDRLDEVVDAGLAEFAARHEQFLEGLITADELAATLRPTAAAVELWRTHGMTWERQAAWARARAALDEIFDYSRAPWLGALYDGSTAEPADQSPITTQSNIT